MWVMPLFNPHTFGPITCIKSAVRWYKYIYIYICIRTYLKSQLNTNMTELARFARSLIRDVQIRAGAVYICMEVRMP